MIGAGSHMLVLSGHEGRALSGGVYIVDVEIDGQSFTRKVTVIR